MGLKGRGVSFMVLGAAVLVGYGFLVNLTALDFGRLMGLYIVLFFVVSQLTALVLFRERLPLPVLVGGLLIVAGGVTMIFWRAP
jgi:small multidrug resistance family-3 protein